MFYEMWGVWIFKGWIGEFYEVNASSDLDMILWNPWLVSPELLAGDVPVEVPGHALRAHEGEHVRVVVVVEPQEARHQRHPLLQQQQ